MQEKPTYKELEQKVRELKNKIIEFKHLEQTLREGERLNELLLDSLPHPAMLIRKDQVILAANRIAKEVGATVDGICWRDFGQSEYIPEEDKRYINQHKGNIPPNGTRCLFCLAPEALKEQKPAHQPEVEAFGEYWDTWWVPIDENTYLHYAINISERKRSDEEKERLISELKDALDEVKKLRGILPLCSFCKKIRNDKGLWEQVDVYIHKYSDADISHSICPECMSKHYPEESQSLLDKDE